MVSSDAEVVRLVQHEVTASLQRHRLTRGRRKLVVAVSGGADSLCLLDALSAVVTHPERRLTVAHVDHRLRPDSAMDAEHVRRIAETMGLPCHVLSVDVPSLAAAERRGVEEAARLGRYRALRQLAADLEQATVVTGHTADDSVETTLLHLLRGTGISGLRGIAESEQLPAAALGSQKPDARPLSLIRPLLSVGRADTVAYCEARGIRFLTDETNSDPRMLRNRVRSHLLPVLRTYNPAVDRALSRLAASLSEDERWLEEHVTRVWRRLAVVDQATGDITIKLVSWQRQPLAVRRRVLRRFAGRSGVPDVGFDAIERALAVGTPGGPPRAELGGGLTVTRKDGALRLRSRMDNRNIVPPDAGAEGNQ